MPLSERGEPEGTSRDFFASNRDLTSSFPDAARVTVKQTSLALSVAVPIVLALCETLSCERWLPALAQLGLVLWLMSV